MAGGNSIPFFLLSLARVTLQNLRHGVSNGVPFLLIPHTSFVISIYLMTVDC